MEHGNPRGISEHPTGDFDAVCQKIRRAIEPARAHAVSLHDERGEVLWLSESSMGPDEHDAVRQAVETFVDPDSPALLVRDLGDTRSAVLLRAVDPDRALAGAVMIVMDSRVLKQDGQGAVLLVTPRLQRALADFTAMRSGAPRGSLPAAAAAATLPEVDRLHAEFRRSPIALHVQRLVPLTKGGQLQRYEVLLRFKSDAAANLAPQAMLTAAVESGLGSMIDRRVVAELIGWLVRHPAVWTGGATLFSVNLTATALHDEHFVKFVELCISKAALPRGTVAFEIDVAEAVRLGEKTSHLAEALDRLGCPLVLDEFSLRTECVELLRMPGVRYVKLTPELTARMRSDKHAQAAITAVVQLARVLGLHTVAKRTENAAEREWLTALGVDFVQSNAFSPPVAIETLTKNS